MSYKNKKNKQFGYLFFLLFLILSFWPMLNSEKINLVLLFISLTFLILTILNSKILNPLSDLWIKFGELLGKLEGHQLGITSISASNDGKKLCISY